MASSFHLTHVQIQKCHSAHLLFYFILFDLIVFNTAKLIGYHRKIRCNVQNKIISFVDKRSERPTNYII